MHLLAGEAHVCPEYKYSYSSTAKEAEGWQLTLCPLFPHYCFNINSNDAPGNPAMENLLEALLDQPGFGTKCMEKEEEDSM